MLDDLEFRGVLLKFFLLNIQTIGCICVLDCFQLTAGLQVMSAISSIHVLIQLPEMKLGIYLL